MARTRFVKLRGVIDASCLIRLLYLNDSSPNLYLFRALNLRYSVIYIPEQVWEEVSRRGRSKRRFRRFVEQYPFFEKCEVGDKYRAQLLYDRQRNPDAPIDRGEAEAIIQASEREITDILIDDRQAAKFAQRHSLNTRDTLELIVELNRNRVIADAKSLVELLHANRKFKLKQRRLEEVLKEIVDS